MRKLRKIMVCIDFSGYSLNTLEYAVEVAERREAELIAINVINQRELVTILKSDHFQHSVEEYVKEKKKQRSEKFQLLCEEAKCNHLPIKLIFKTGIPFREIIKAVEEENANLLVLNSKGRSDLKGTIFGTTAEKLLRHCPVPVLSLRKTLPERK